MAQLEAVLKVAMEEKEKTLRPEIRLLNQVCMGRLHPRNVLALLLVAHSAGCAALVQCFCHEGDIGPALNMS